MAMATAACRRPAVMLMAFAMAAAVTMSSVPPASGTTTLQYDFYSSSCPKAEETVRNVVEPMIFNDPTMGAAFIRLFFHDCFVRVRTKLSFIKHISFVVNSSTCHIWIGLIQFNNNNLHSCLPNTISLTMF
jgi:hypothetical protein